MRAGRVVMIIDDKIVWNILKFRENHSRLLHDLSNGFRGSGCVAQEIKTC
jgi:hypothetical protein